MSTDKNSDTNLNTNLEKNIQNQAQAFAAGSQVWIIADLNQSRWAQKLDWYLNFQLRKASLHTPKEISPAHQSQIKDWGVDLEKLVTTRKLDAAKSPLMIASHQLLPNRWTLQIPFQEISSWILNCVKTLTDLKQTQARVFLPSEISKETFMAAVPMSGRHLEFELVEEGALA